MSVASAPDNPGDRDFFGGRLNLEQQKKRAKELLKGFQDGAKNAIARVKAHHPSAGEEVFRLADAQLVIARENGFSSWPRMKTHIERLRIDRLRLESGNADAPDTARTVHIRCGEDIRHGLEVAGFVGRFLEFSDPYCQGPVPRTDKDDLIARRAQFISQGYSRRAQEAEARLRAQYDAIDELAAGVPTVLWFEHDSYDQLILARLLSVFHMREKKPDLRMICVGQVPGVSGFVGLGQLHPEVLLWLWNCELKPVAPEQLRDGAAAWGAITDEDPSDLARMTAAGIPSLPLMAPALQRHLKELPAPRTGLGLTQALALTILSEHGSMPAGRIYQFLMKRYEPLPFLGDLMFWHVMTDLSEGADPVVIVDPMSAELPWPKRTFSLSATGRKVLAGEQDFVELMPSSRWVGGVEIRPRSLCWRWDPERNEVRRA